VSFEKVDVRFPSGEGECAGDLYLPEVRRPVPVVVMAHGIGAERAFGLAAFAERFAARGLAALVFDYRNFGDSPGEPRCLVSPARHVQDYLSALDFVRGHRRLDGGRIGLWGTSFSGGHVLVVAGRAPQGVRAVVSQVPFVSGIASTLVYPYRYQIPALLMGLWDGLKGLLGLAPTTVAVTRERGVALLASPDSWEGYRAMVPEGTAWPGRVPARVFVAVLTYRPLTAAARVRAPTLMMVARDDALCPVRANRRAARRIPDCRLEEFPIGHFDPYRGEWFEKFVGMQGEFLEKRLG
jgi:pimeloyl-ACP methyl ester carboxylesterase